MLTLTFNAMELYDDKDNTVKSNFLNLFEDNVEKTKINDKSN